MMRLLAFLLITPSAAHAFDRHQNPGDLPRALGQRDPSQPSEPVPPARYRSVTATTKTYRPVDPLPWPELNRRVTPRPKQEPAKREPAAIPKRN